MTEAPRRLVPLGDAHAAACDGDVCVRPAMPEEDGDTPVLRRPDLDTTALTANG